MDWAAELLDHFSWGPAFLEINKEILEVYQQCTDSESVQKAQEEWLDKLEEEVRQRKEHGSSEDLWLQGNTNHAGGLPPTSDSEEESEEEKDSVPSTAKYDKLGNLIVEEDEDDDEDEDEDEDERDSEDEEGNEKQELSDSELDGINRLAIH